MRSLSLKESIQIEIKGSKGHCGDGREGGKASAGNQRSQRRLETSDPLNSRWETGMPWPQSGDPRSAETKARRHSNKASPQIPVYTTDQGGRRRSK